MEGERRHDINKPKIVQIDISKGWDIQSQAAIFIEKIRDKPFYRPDLLYCGFSANNIKEVRRNPGEIVYCSTESEILSEESTFVNQNPIDYAIRDDNGAVGIYDPQKLVEGLAPQGYTIKEPGALIAIAKLK